MTVRMTGTAILLHIHACSRHMENEGVTDTKARESAVTSCMTHLSNADHMQMTKCYEIVGMKLFQFLNTGAS